MDQNYVEFAVELLNGPKATGRIVGRTHQAVLKWIKSARLPRTEATGETQYAELMAAANPKISKKKLLATVYRNGAP
jgi:hypothetical protein